ncbi:MAG TPA: M3 family metallopeptidase, partial [bacterium]|nr:M3 family metallopeptidase [bacterium]
RGLEGKWLITLQNTTIQPALTSLKNRALREKIFKASVNRATSGDTDNTVVVSKLVALRARKGTLLGAKSWAAYSLAEETAGTPEAVNKMIAELAPAAVGRAKNEAAEIQKLIDAEAAANHTAPFKVEPWDWDYYSEQVRKAKYAFDESEVKPYFELEHVLQDGVFYAAHELYGVTFKERKDLPVYQKDVRTFEVFDADGSTIGLFIFDAFKRDNKQGGAWMDNYVDQSFLLGTKPVIVNNLNLAHAAPGEPQLLTFDEVTGAFHEFGHATHGLFSKAKYPLISGTATPRDFVEYPSQANEMWAREPAVLAHFAKHYKTGEPLPKALFDKVLAAQTFNEGYATTEYLAAAALDIAWHELPAAQIPAPAKVTAFDDAALKKLGLSYGPVPPRYHTTYFNHAFSGGYDAAYYAYIWSEVLARDTGYWFHTHGGLSRANGDFYRAKILSRGRIEEPAVLFRNFFGGDPIIEPLLEYRGLAAPKAPAKKPVEKTAADKKS